MRYTVQYIPLNKIKQDNTNTKTSPRKKEFKKVAQDLMQLLIVQKSKKDGDYIIQDGHHHFAFLKKHTNKNRAVCLVDESKMSTNFGNFVNRFRKRQLPYDIPYLKPNRFEINSWTIIRKFLKQEPRFRMLSRSQQLKVIRLGIQYRKTTVQSMQAKVEDMIKRL
ncbi:hypothetical protein [Paenibacillus qinlingensis]|uniref:Uncharacterized protein n=1 Tax=Paenibacillus qinlingensis TaxID=1837343 RepID=A0ABU1NTC1_9BACL|nr:hypothetical protein [Paenibacillus qinlingensis]MDR6550735.1 hypothetical protein [Paenibacillus qinlingensis]